MERTREGGGGFRKVFSFGELGYRGACGWFEGKESSSRKDSWEREERKKKKKPGEEEEGWLAEFLPTLLEMIIVKYVYCGFPIHFN